MNFVPFLTSPNSQALPNPNASISIPEVPTVTIIATLLLIAALAITGYKVKIIRNIKNRKSKAC